jgi:hypothetical protein
MNIQEFKEQLVVEGLASVEKNETRPERIRGGKDGFEICRELETMKDFWHTLDQRYDHELDLQRPGTTPAEYWEYRYATVQIEYVYERMLVVWSQIGMYDGPLSARAVLRTAEIVGVKDGTA